MGKCAGVRAHSCGRAAKLAGACPGLNLGKHNVGNAVDMLAERALAE